MSHMVILLGTPSFHQVHPPSPWIRVHVIVCKFPWQVSRLYSTPENIYSHPEEGYRKFQGGRGDLKPTFLKESMSKNWNWLGGGGGNYTKTHSVEEVWLFSGTIIVVDQDERIENVNKQQLRTFAPIATAHL